ncbi:MAG: cytochrome b [Pseudomonadota bacterium]
MSLKNSSISYGTIAKWMHWSTALLFLFAYLTVYYRQWFTEQRTPENITALQLHLSIGITVAVIVVLRVLWRLFNRPPDLEPGTRLEHAAAHLAHYALYAVMIIAPITGYLGTGVSTDYFFLFEIPKFEETALFTSVVSERFGLTFKEFEAPLDFVHKKILGEWLIWILVLGHAAAALYHHYVKHDDTMKKMTTKRA